MKETKVNMRVRNQNPKRGSGNIEKGKKKSKKKKKEEKEECK